VSGATAAADGHDRLIPFFSAIIAVLAALGTLFSHHRSIQALALRNEALLLTAKASDQYNYYQTQQLKATLYRALLAENPSSQTGKADTLRNSLKAEERSSIAVFVQARAFEQQAEDEQQRAVALLESFERLEIATTLFEISIAFASIAALTSARLMLWVGVMLSAFGLVLGLIGYFRVH
jgi:Domain of unknown function (DUF4337)